jgi:hypothetical protein
VRRAKLTYLRKRLGKGATLVNEKQEKAVSRTGEVILRTKFHKGGAKASPFFVCCAAWLDYGFSKICQYNLSIGLRSGE